MKFHLEDVRDCFLLVPPQIFAGFSSTNIFVCQGISKGVSRMCWADRVSFWYLSLDQIVANQQKWGHSLGLTAGSLSARQSDASHCYLTVVCRSASQSTGICINDCFFTKSLEVIPKRTLENISVKKVILRKNTEITFIRTPGQTSEDIFWKTLLVIPKTL